jgi:hypothetical protein
MNGVFLSPERAGRPISFAPLALVSLRGAAATLLAACLVSSGPSEAQQRSTLPDVVLDHIQQLDQRCSAAGGRAAGGRFVIAQDFSGDGRTDFLLSEGDYACAGRPGMFRRDGLARVAIYVSNASGGARRAFFETLAAYRVLAGEPARVQVARRGASCGNGTPPTGLCGGTLAWNGRAMTLGEAATGATTTEPAPSAPRPVAADRPSTALAGASPTPPTGSPAAVPEPAPSATLPVETRPAVAAAGGAGPATSSTLADLLLSVVPEKPGLRPTLDTVRQAATGVRWAAKATPRSLASGTFGGLAVIVTGREQPDSLGVSWMKTGAMIPFDVPRAMRQRGITVTQMSCEKLGVGEGQRVYDVTAAGRAPFALTIEQRTAPTASANSYYGATVDLQGRRQPRGPATDCDF